MDAMCFQVVVEGATQFPAAVTLQVAIDKAFQLRYDEARQAGVWDLRDGKVYFPRSMRECEILFNQLQGDRNAKVSEERPRSL